MIELTSVSLPERSELWESALKNLRNAILTGELPAGTRLIEADLSDTLHVSRWPIRQAIARLEQENLVVRYRNRGAYVIEFAAQDIQEIYALRRLLEGYAAREACASLTEEVDANLVRLIDELDRAVRSRDLPGAVEPDMAFHRAICEAANSERLLKMWEVLVAPAHALLVMCYARLGEKLASRLASTHREMLAALRSGDPDAAEATMRRHLGLSEDTLLALSARPD